MRSLKEMSGQEALNQSMSLFSRATLPAENPAFRHMCGMVWDICRGALPEACRLYHEGVRAMLESPALRASGDLWKDELLRCAILEEHPFALSAAAGRRDPAQMAAMREELQILRGLFELDSRTVLAMMKERMPKGQRDGISMMSAAVWSGNAKGTQRQGEELVPCPAMPLYLTPWEYGRGCLEGDWAAQEALEELYMRFLESDDWAALADDLHSFFAAYGAGLFLKDRAFRVSGDKLCPLNISAINPLYPVSLYEREHMALMENTIAFMRGEGCGHMMLWGEGGLGKTAQVASLLHELPEVRLILASRNDMEGLPGILERIGGQPLRFVLLLDDLPGDCREMRTFASRTLGFGALPANVVVYATSREPGGSLFPASLRFAYPTLPQFAALIWEIMECRGQRADKQEIHNAAVDHQVDVREKLTFPGALAIAERLYRK